MIDETTAEDGDAMPSDVGAELARLTDLATPYAVRTAVTLRLPELVADGHTTIGALAERCGADADALARLLRYLVAHGLFAEPEPGTFELTGVSRLLTEEGARPVREWLNLDGPGARMDAAFSALPHSVRTGQEAYGAVHGLPFWQDLAAKPELRRFFDDVMSAHSYQTAPLVAEDDVWTGLRTVVDVGGGNGALLTRILLAHPHLTGKVLDGAQTVAAARDRFADAGLGGRADAVAGSFFDPLPEGADAYLLSRVLTDWNDESATTILKRCAEAAAPDGRVLIIEVQPDENDAGSPYDLQMLVLVGGRRRTLADFTELATAAGLTVTGSRHQDGGLMLIECRPAPA